MRRLVVLLGAMLAVVLLAAPTAVMAATAPTPAVTPSGPVTSAPAAATSTGPTPAVGQPVPASGGSTTMSDALTIVGFSIVAMAALILLLRAGLKSADADDDD